LLSWKRKKSDRAQQQSADIEKKETPVNTIKLAAAVVGLAAAILGFAPAAQAVEGGGAAQEVKIGIDHLDWLDDIRPKVSVPNVDSSVKHREIVLPLP
jgi:hypothetical protein